VVVWVNGIRVTVIPGMKVRHALMGAGLIDEVKRGRKVYDEAGNEAGLDGALSEGLRLVVSAQAVDPVDPSSKLP
jgi:hypothetical protein